MKLRPLKIPDNDIGKAIRYNERELGGYLDAINYYKNVTHEEIRSTDYTRHLTIDIAPINMESEINLRKAARIMFPVLPDRTEERIIDAYFGERYIMPRMSIAAFKKQISTTSYKENVDLKIQDFIEEEGPSLLAIYGGFGKSYLLKTEHIGSLNEKYIKENFGADYIELQLESMIDKYSELNEAMSYRARLLEEDFRTVTKYFYDKEKNKMIFITNNAKGESLHIPILIYSLFQDLNDKQKKFIEELLNEGGDTIERSDIANMDFMAGLYEKMKPKTEEINLEYYDPSEGIEKAKNMIKAQSESESRRLDGDIYARNREIEDLIERIERVDKRIKELQIKKFYIDHQLGGSDDNPLKELIDFLYNNKDVIDFYIDEGSNAIVVGIKTYLDIYEEEYMRIAYRNSSKSSNHPNQILAKQIFLDANYRIKIQGIFVLFLRDNSISFLRVEDSNSSHDLRKNMKAYNQITKQEFYTNPHLEHYDCSGANREQIKTALTNKNYIAALMATFATYRGLNFVDGTVMETFYREMKQADRFGNKKILEDYEGNTITPIEMIAKVRREMNGSSEQTVHEDSERTPF